MINAEKLKEIGLTSEQLRSFRYFYFEKGDFTRWTEFANLKQKLETAFPEIMEQIEIMERAQNNLNYLFNNVADLADEVEQS